MLSKGLPPLNARIPPSRRFVFPLFNRFFAVSFLSVCAIRASAQPLDSVLLGEGSGVLATLSLEMAVTPFPSGLGMLPLPDSRAASIAASAPLDLSEPGSLGTFLFGSLTRPSTSRAFGTQESGGFLLSQDVPSVDAPPDPTRASEGLRVKAFEILRGQSAVFGVAFRDLRTGETLLINARDRMHAASTMKIPVMMAIFEMIDEGTLSLDTPIPIKNDFKSIVDGSSFQVEVDNDGSLYRYIGQTRPLRELVNVMIVRSANLATNLLVEQCGVERIMNVVRRAGATNTRILRGVEDIKAYQKGLNNESDAFDMLNLIWACRDSPGFSPASRTAMMEILRHQEKTEMIPAGLPGGAGVRVAHKTGSVSQVQHDAAIVDLPGGGSFALVIYSRDFKDRRQKTIDTGRKLTALLYEHVQTQNPNRSN